LLLYFILLLMENKIEFILKICNIPGKNIAQNYLNDIKIRLDKLSLNYKLQMLTDNNSDSFSGGAEMTFPYNYFEKIFNATFKDENNIEPSNLEENQPNFSNDIINIIFTIYNVGNNYGNIGGLKQFEYWLSNKEKII